jgi:hypothetical protein
LIPVPTPLPGEPHTIEGLLRALEARDGEVAVLRLMVTSSSCNCCAARALRQLQ